MPSASHRSPKLAPARPGRPSIARFLPYLKGYRWQFAFSFAMAPVGVGLSISIPLLLGGVVDGPISDGDVLGVLWFALALRRAPAGPATPQGFDLSAGAAGSARR